MALDLVEDILELSPTCELHSQPLRNSLLRLLTIKPDLNSGSHNGSVWVHQRAERITVILGHIRRLARSGMTSRCASELTAAELKKLTQVVEAVQIPDEPEGPLENEQLQESETPLENGDQPSTKRRLKEQISLDSEGYPMILKSPKAVTPEKVNKEEAGPSRLLQKRKTQGQLLGNVAANPDLRKEMALGSKEPAAGPRGLKRPAAARGILKKPAAAEKADDSKHWLKLQRTNAKKPERSYILGTKDAGQPPRLIVEVSRARTQQYRLVISKIFKALQEDNLSKEAAIALRERLCLKHK
eukprot:Skav229293  [mRNA]  locus=scaffold544:118273:119172:- [translate_table: standard]